MIITELFDGNFKNKSELEFSQFFPTHPLNNSDIYKYSYDSF